MIGYSNPSGANLPGAAIGGLFQGIQAGQQMNSNDQQMQILQDQVNQQREDRLKLDLNEAMWNIELGGSPAALNTLMQDNPDYFAETLPDGVTQVMPNMRRFNSDDIIWEDSMGNQVDGENEDATLSNQTKNMLAGHPLADKLFANPQDYKSLQDQMYMYTDSEGERLYNPEHFELGSSNYAKFKREKLQKEALANAKIASQTKPGKEQDKSAYMQVFNEWQGIKEDVKDDKATKATKAAKKVALKQQLDQLSSDKATPGEFEELLNRKNKLDHKDPAKAEELAYIKQRLKHMTEWAPKPEKTSATRSREAKDKDAVKQATDSFNYLSKTFDAASPINEQDISIEALRRNNKDFSDSKLSAQVDEAKKLSTTIKSVERLQSLMAKEGFKSGPMDQYLNTLKAMTPEEWAVVDYDNIAANAGINTEIASILKELSGTAASDSERLNTLISVVGSPTASEGARRSTIGGYLTNRRKKLTDVAQQLSKDNLPQTAKELIQGLNVSGNVTQERPGAPISAGSKFKNMIKKGRI